MASTLTFTAANGRYESQRISAAPNMALQLEFAQPYNNEITIYESVDGDHYAVGATLQYSERVFVKTLSGAVEGTYLKIATKNQPTVGLYV